MPYYLKGTVDLLRYRNTLGRPCSLRQLSDASEIPIINFMGAGRDSVSFVASYGEVQAQNIAACLGTTVGNVNTNGGQFQI